MKGVEADLLPIPFLQEERDWERVDVWVPKGLNGPAPCVVVIFGGGYGDKNAPTAHIKPLLEAGFVVAMPDYVLQAQMTEAIACWDIDASIRFLRKMPSNFRLILNGLGCGVFGRRLDRAKSFL